MSESTLTQKEYVAAQGCACPNCDSNEGLEFGEYDFNMGEATQDAKCNICGAEWVDVYVLTGIRELKLP